MRKMKQNSNQNQNMNNEKRIYKRELAKAYAPELTYYAALHRLSLWINTHPQLRKALKRTGYTPKQKTLTERQKMLIIKYLGEP